MRSRRAFTYKFLLFTLGFVAMSVQIVFIREALAVFHGNELVIGLCLGLWMVLTAAGSLIGSRFSYPDSPGPIRRLGPAILLIILIILPLFMPWELAYLRSNLLPAGVMAGIGHIALILLITLSPFCLASGFLFPVLAASLSSSKKKSLAHQAYALDSAGSILGGIIFSIFLFNLQPYILNLRPGINKLLYSGQQVIETRQTPFGKLTITKLEEQYNLYDNGIPMSLPGDAVQREESVHYAMLLHEKPGEVLMISGGIGGAIEEIFKYPVVRVDYLDINPWIIPLADNYLPFPRYGNLRIISQDPRIFLDREEMKYDVILLNTPDPGSAELNRFYTKEFFRIIRERLNPGGILSLSIAAAGNYMNESSRMLHSVMFATLSSEFRNIRIVPGNRDYFLASDRDLSHSFWDNLKKEGISNLYVNPGYIDEKSMNSRSILILNEIIPGVKNNSDLNPYIYVQIYRQWLEQFRTDYRIIPAVLVILVLLAFILLGPVNLGLFTGGFTASSLEFILILWFQALYGIVYQVTGLIFAAFMAGMAAGSVLAPKVFKSKAKAGFLKIQAAFFIYPLLLAPVMIFVPYGTPSWFKIALIFSLVILAGSLMGMLFALAGLLQKGNISRSSGQAFSADLTGSATGIILASLYLVPHFGLPVTGLVLAALNILALVVFFFKSRLTATD